MPDRRGVRGWRLACEGLGARRVCGKVATPRVAHDTQGSAAGGSRRKSCSQPRSLVWHRSRRCHLRSLCQRLASCIRMSWTVEWPRPHARTMYTCIVRRGLLCGRGMSALSPAVHGVAVACAALPRHMARLKDFNSDVLVVPNLRSAWHAPAGDLWVPLFFWWSMWRVVVRSHLGAIAYTAGCLCAQ